MSILVVLLIVAGFIRMRIKSARAGDRRMRVERFGRQRAMVTLRKQLAR